MQPEFYWDAAGDPRARGEGPAGKLARFLESDLQGSAAHGRAVLRAIERIEDGDLDSWESTGNAYTLTLTPEGASLVHEIADKADPLELSLSQLKEAVADWTAFVDEEA